jgi:hypothetical protein
MMRAADYARSVRTASAMPLAPGRSPLDRLDDRRRADRLIAASVMPVHEPKDRKTRIWFLVKKHHQMFFLS